MITESASFSCDHSNYCNGNKLLHFNHTAYNLKLSLKNGIKQEKAAQNTCPKGVSSTQLLRIQTRKIWLKRSKQYLLGFYHQL